jgi:LacI family transcriptional regulator
VVPVYDARIVRILAGIAVPIVNTDGCLDPSPYPCIVADQDRVAALAWRHLAEIGCRRFACLGVEDRASSDRLLAAFRRHVGLAGGTVACERMPTGWRNPALGIASSTQADDRLARFLDGLEPGTGLLAWGDQMAVLALQMLGVRASGPHGIRLLASNDAEILEEQAIGISAVRFDPEHQALAVVEMLEGMLKQPGALPTARVLAPAEVVRRASTGAGEDDLVGRALAILREEPGVGVGIRQVAIRLGVSTRSLERAFKREVGRTPREIRREALIEHARALMGSGVPGPEVARRCGFARPAALRRLLQPGG